MVVATDSTESLLIRTKKLLDARGDTALREIAEGADVNLDWLKSFSCGRASNPGVLTIEKLFAYLTEFYAAKRFEKRAEVRAN